MDLDGKTVLLTGATGGLGRAIARALAGRGARLVLSARGREALEALAGELEGEHRVAPADLAAEGAVEALLAEAGELDVLVANAALPATGELDSFSEVDLARALRVNFEVPVRMARALLPAMRARGEGHMVFVASLSGKAATPRSSLYNATKFGLRGFALGLREDLRGGPVGVSLVTPGFIREAGMFADSGQKAPPGLGTRSPGDVAAAVVRAIERDKGEVEVATPQLRLLANFALMAPELAGRLAGRQATKRAEQLAAGQTGKR